MTWARKMVCVYVRGKGYWDVEGNRNGRRGRENVSIGMDMNEDNINERKGEDTNWVYGGNGRWREHMVGRMTKPMGGEERIVIRENL